MVLARSVSMNRVVKPISHKMREGEISEVSEGLQNHPWNRSLTVGVAGPVASPGDVWESVRKGLAKLNKRDPNARYAVWVCTNIKDDGSEGRPHAHGVLQTSLTQGQIRSCFYSFGDNSFDTKSIGDRDDLERWVKYFLPQALRGSDSTNVPMEEWQ
jgi:hypothetical protein